MPRLQFSLVILAQLSQRALGHVHLSPKHPNNLQLCNVAAHFLRLFPMILYFHILLLEISLSFAVWRHVFSFILKFI